MYGILLAAETSELGAFISTLCTLVIPKRSVNSLGITKGNVKPCPVEVLRLPALKLLTVADSPEFQEQCTFAL